MKLHTTEWGDGPKTAVLIHGLASHSGTWHRVAPALAHEGYRAIAVDLRGHGRSPRGYYSPEALAGDLVENLPHGADLAIGHSLGGAALRLAADRLKPQRIVYIEPYWNVTAVTVPPDVQIFSRFGEADRAELARLNPGWSGADIDCETAAHTQWDRRTLIDLHGFDMPTAPDHPEVPTMIQLAAPGQRVVVMDEADLERRGFDVVTFPQGGHSLYHDSFPEFLDTLQGWL